MMEDYKKIRYIKLKFTLMFDGDTTLVRDKTSAIRGGIGEMLLRAHCISGRACDSCGFRKECLVQRIMYSSMDTAQSGVHEGDGFGYVLLCDDRRKEYAAGDTLEFF